MTELEINKETAKAKRIKQVKIFAPIGGALIGYLISKGAFYGTPKTPSKKRMIASIVVGALIGYGVGYLGIKKIQNEKNK